ncbi:S-adenosyl-L-methionine-dependent methyltransferase [Umbelopsis sp. PMI_123]|nr:S-adenosyl-L-methionine-dependent methyltransferase [Umbelopsis sp. PMI_123]
MPNEIVIQSSTSLVFSIVLFSFIVTVYSLRHASSRYLEPIYGNVFPYYYLNEIIILVLILAFTIVSGTKVLRGRTISSHEIVAKLCNTAALLLALSPLMMDTLFSFSSYLGPLWGPHVTQLPVLHATIFLLGISFAISGTQWLISQRKRLDIFAPLVSLCTAYIVCQLLQAHLFTRLYCQIILLNSATLGVSGALLSFNISHSNQNRGRVAATYFKLLPQVIVAMVLVYVYTRSPHCGHHLKREQLIPNTKWKILDKVDSITGLIEVAEESGNMNMRVMRSGHSLLGGRYRDTGDSIFQTFNLLEAVRAFDRPKCDDQSIRALQIGLGCGISTNALLSQGIDVDVVELDPAVYYMARDYFDLMQPSSVYLESGRTFLERCNSSSYDFVLHDIFTGGSVAPGMFSREVMELIKRSLKTNGIIAINFAGSERADLRTGLDMVATTLNTVFQHVVCYRDTEDSSVKYTNYMFLAADFPLTFHSLKDNRRSFSQKTTNILSRLDKVSVDINVSLHNGIVTDKSLEKLRASGIGAAKEHWMVMRQILGDDFWLTF